MATQITPVVAWWGAVVATLVLIWDIYKWRRTGPRVFVEARGNQSVVGSPRHEEGTYVLVLAKNRGDCATTITGLGMRWFANAKDKARKKAGKNFLIIAETTQPLPYLLQPGGLWQGFFQEKAELRDLAGSGFLMCEVYCTHTDKAPTAKLTLCQRANQEGSGGT